MSSKKDDYIAETQRFQRIAGVPVTPEDVLGAEWEEMIAKRVSARRRRSSSLPPLPQIQFHQSDWIPGWAAFLPDATTPNPDSKAFCVLNLGCFMASLEEGDLPREDLPYAIAESMMHEVIHVLEQWAGVEFNEERVEALLTRYRAAYRGEDPEENSREGETQASAEEVARELRSWVAEFGEVSETGRGARITRLVREAADLLGG